MPAQNALAILTRPLSGGDLPQLWNMLQEFPEFNFDDAGPQSFDDFEELMADRVHRDILVVFEVSGELAGVMAYQGLSPRSGMLRGVCFSKAVHGTGIPVAALRNAIAALYADGIEKISAQMFADNARAWRFFQKLGAVEEGLLRAHALRAGVAIDVRLIAWFKNEENT